MPSPFPGMDPYLEDEALWPLFQHQLVAGLYQIILPGLVDRYRARIQQRMYVTEEPLFTSVIRQERHEEYIRLMADLVNHRGGDPVPDHALPGHAPLRVRAQPKPAPAATSTTSASRFRCSRPTRSPTGTARWQGTHARPGRCHRAAG